MNQLLVEPLVFEVVETGFREVAPIWSDKLWPGRESTIEEVSAIGPEGEINLNWRRALPLYWKIEIEGEIKGVLSTLLLSGAEARLRGLWVSEDFRGRGFAKTLIRTAFSTAKKRGYHGAWTMARQSATQFYISCGFQPLREIHGYEFGPHVIMQAKIN